MTRFFFYITLLALLMGGGTLAGYALVAMVLSFAGWMLFGPEGLWW